MADVNYEVFEPEFKGDDRVTRIGGANDQPLSKQLNSIRLEQGASGSVYYRLDATNNVPQVRELLERAGYPIADGDVRNGSILLRRAPHDLATIEPGQAIKETRLLNADDLRPLLKTLSTDVELGRGDSLYGVIKTETANAIVDRDMTARGIKPSQAGIVKIETIDFDVERHGERGIRGSVEAEIPDGAVSRIVENTSAAAIGDKHVAQVSTQIEMRDPYQANAVKSSLEKEGISTRVRRGDDIVRVVDGRADNAALETVLKERGIEFRHAQNSSTWKFQSPEDADVAKALMSKAQPAVTFDTPTPAVHITAGAPADEVASALGKSGHVQGNIANEIAETALAVHPEQAATNQAIRDAAPQASAGAEPKTVAPEAKAPNPELEQMRHRLAAQGRGRSVMESGRQFGRMSGMQPRDLHAPLRPLPERTAAEPTVGSAPAERVTPEMAARREAGWHLMDQIHTQDKFSFRETVPGRVQYTFSGENLDEVQAALRNAGIESDRVGRGLAIRPEHNNAYMELRTEAERFGYGEMERPVVRVDAPEPVTRSAEPRPVADVAELTVRPASEPKAQPIPERAELNNWGLRRGAPAPDLADVSPVRATARGPVAVDAPTVVPEPVRVAPIESPHAGRTPLGGRLAAAGTVAGVALVGGVIVADGMNRNLEVGEDRSGAVSRTGRDMLKGVVLDTGLRDLERMTRETTVAGKVDAGIDMVAAAGTVITGTDLKGARREGRLDEPAAAVPAERVVAIRKALVDAASTTDQDLGQIPDPRLRLLFDLQARRARGETEVNVVQGIDGVRINGDGTPRSEIQNAVQSNGGIFTVASRYVDTARSDWHRALGLQPLTDGRIENANIDALIEQETRRYIAGGGSETSIREATDLNFRSEQRFLKLFNTVPDSNMPGYKEFAVEAVNGHDQLVEFRSLVQSGSQNTPEGHARLVEISNQYYKEWDYDDATALQFASRSYSRTEFTIARPADLVAAGMGGVFNITGRPEDVRTDMENISKVLNTEYDGRSIQSRINPGSDWSAGVHDVYAALPPQMQQQVNAESVRLQEQAKLAVPTEVAVAPAAPVVAEEVPAAEPDIVVSASLPKAEVRARAREVKGDVKEAFSEAGLLASLDANGDGRVMLEEVMRAARAAGIRDSNGGTLDATEINSGVAQSLIQRSREGSGVA